MLRDFSCVSLFFFSYHYSLYCPNFISILTLIVSSRAVGVWLRHSTFQLHSKGLFLPRCSWALFLSFCFWTWASFLSVWSPRNDCMLCRRRWTFQLFIPRIRHESADVQFSSRLCEEYFFSLCFRFRLWVFFLCVYCFSAWFLGSRISDVEDSPSETDSLTYRLENEILFLKSCLNEAEGTIRLLLARTPSSPSVSFAERKRASQK